MVDHPHPFKDYPGGERIKSLGELKNLRGKKVFLRVDFNVPLKEGKVSDDSRIRAALPTLEFLQKEGARILCASHLGRPQGKPDLKYTLEPVAAHLGELLSTEVIFSDNSVGTAISKEARNLKEGRILVLENLRFHPGEETNNKEYAYKLAELCEVYVNDAFGTCHRAHASTDALPRIMNEKAAGFLLEKEISALSTLIYNPQRPLMAILGGAKVSDKIKVIESLMVKSSKILVGGAMAYTFLRALKVKTGKSLVEPNQIALAEKILERSTKANCKIVLPMDHIVEGTNESPTTTENAHVPEGKVAYDIGTRTRELFKRELAGAASIFWNGPLGFFEKAPFNEGTFFIARVVADHPAKIKICGGGDSVAAIHEAGLSSGFSHISTGGGASLEMIEGSPMPGLEALKI